MAPPLSQDDSQPPAAHAPGWHPHPDYDTVERYWDGTRWSGEHRFALAREDSADEAPVARPPWTSEQSWIAGTLAACVAVCALGVLLASGQDAGHEPLLVMLSLFALLGLIVPRHWSAIVIAAVLGLVLGIFLESFTQCPPVLFAACDEDGGSVVGYGVVTAWTNAAAMAGAQALRLLVEPWFANPRRDPP